MARLRVEKYTLGPLENNTYLVWDPASKDAVIVDPLATIPAFLVMAAGDTAAKRSRMARQAAWTCFLVLSALAVAGSAIFALFGITPPAFKIAGGLLLFMVALDMLQAKRSGTQEVSEERAEGLEKEEVGVAPIGIPMLAGPGAISTVMVLTHGGVMNTTISRKKVAIAISTAVT